MVEYDPDLEYLRNLKPARVLRAISILRGRIAAPGSTSGLVAERLEQGIATREPYAGGGGDVQRLELAWLIGLTRGLTDLEQRACALRYGSTGELEEYERIRQGEPSEGDGELVLPTPAQTDYEGKALTKPWTRVRGYRERLPNHAEVAAALAREGWRNADGNPMSTGATEKALRTANEKIDTAIKARLLLAELEDRACG